MMKIVFFFALSFYSASAFAQLDFKNSNVGRVVEFTDLNGHSLLRKYDPDVTGSPFLNDSWALAKITLSKGKEIGPLEIKLNIESNELYFLDSSGRELIAADGLIRKVDFVEFSSEDGIPYIFENGFPAIDHQNANYYYQVLSAGKIDLLAKRFKYVRTEKNDLSGEISKEFVEGGAVLYVYANDSMQQFHSTKSFVLSLLKDKEETIKLFIEANKLNLKNVANLIELFNYYNRSQR